MLGFHRKKNLVADFSLRMNRIGYGLLRKQAFKKSQEKRKIVTDVGYSYKPFDDKRAIFIHIPKCAGVSVNKALFGNLAGGHTTLEQYLKIFELSCINSYFKFTVVRNPWDRLVSAFFFLKSGGINDSDRRWADTELAVYSDFRSFVKGWVNTENIWKWHHFRPQYHYFQDKKRLVPLDFVAFSETLCTDFEYIKWRVGSDRAITLERQNMGEHARYVDYYDDETKKIVESVYNKDIRILGYNFDNSSLPEQVRQRDLLLHTSPEI